MSLYQLHAMDEYGHEHTATYHGDRTEKEYIYHRDSRSKFYPNGPTRKDALREARRFFYDYIFHLG